MAKTLQDYLKSPNNVVLLIILGVILLVGIVFALTRPGSGGGTIDPDQIRLQKGDKIITVNKNGLIEYKTSEGVFYQTWDSSQIANFFAYIETRAREYLKNPDSSVCETGYTVTLYLDGKEVIVCIIDNDEVLDEVFQEFPDEGDNGDIGDIFDEVFDDDGIITGTGTPTLTPTPGEIAADEGEDVGGDGGGGLPIVSCDLNQEDVTSRTVISNILCAPDEPSPTPTPTPTP